MRQAGRQAVVLRAGNALSLSLSFLYIRNSPILSRAREYMREGKAPKKGMLLLLLPHPRRRRRLYTLLSSYSPFCAPRTTRRRAVIILLSRVYTLLPSVPLSLSLSSSLSLLVYSDAAGAYSRVAVRNFACGLSSLSLSLSISNWCAALLWYYRAAEFHSVPRQIGDECFWWTRGAVFPSKLLLGLHARVLVQFVKMKMFRRKGVE